jgi:hypothetical protein
MTEKGRISFQKVFICGRAARFDSARTNDFSDQHHPKGIDPVGIVVIDGAG